jgi:hypothetical protein
VRVRVKGRFVKKDAVRQTWPLDGTTTTGGHDAHDPRTHIERINPGDNPAYVPGLGGAKPR